MAAIFPFTAPPPVELFAVDDQSAQLTWRRLGTEAVEVEAPTNAIVEITGDGAVGCALVTGLAAQSESTITVSCGRFRQTITVETLPAIANRPHTKIATISDLHFGERSFGMVIQRDEKPNPLGYHPWRCATAALAELTRWGAELLVIKGDLTNGGQPEQWAEFDRFRELVDIPIMAIPGNHDTAQKKGSLDARRQLRDRDLFIGPVDIVDLEHVRVVTVDVTIPGHSWGGIRRHLEELEVAVDTHRPVLLFCHQHIQRTPVPWFWPLGIPRHDGFLTVNRLIEINPNLVLSSGHTHRNRSRINGTAMMTEVGSVKDFPGVWAGYTVDAKSIMQTVRRVAAAEALPWTEWTHQAVGGIWGRWSRGTLAGRCRTHNFVTEGQPAEAAQQILP